MAVVAVAADARLQEGARLQRQAGAEAGQPGPVHAAVACPLAEGPVPLRVGREAAGRAAYPAVPEPEPAAGRAASGRPAGRRAQRDVLGRERRALAMRGQPRLEPRQREAWATDPERAKAAPAGVRPECWAGSLARFSRAAVRQVSRHFRAVKQPAASQRERDGFEAGREQAAVERPGGALALRPVHPEGWREEQREWEPAVAQAEEQWALEAERGVAPELPPRAVEQVAGLAQRAQDAEPARQGPAVEPAEAQHGGPERRVRGAVPRAAPEQARGAAQGAVRARRVRDAERAQQAAEPGVEQLARGVELAAPEGHRAAADACAGRPVRSGRLGRR